MIEFDNIPIHRRIELMANLGAYISYNDEQWQHAKLMAERSNAWFSAAHIDLAANNIATQYLDRAKLEHWVSGYTLPDNPRTVGIVMAGNIPLVGFHDLLCGFISGHRLMLKLSSKDEVLMRHIIGKLYEWEPATRHIITVAERLNGCDAYIATGSNNTARYFEQYFAQYPHIIRRNRTSVAVLDGAETDEELSLLGDDVYMYYGLGCRNVTQVCIPPDYDFARLLRAFDRHAEYANFHKYKNNYDYHLAIYLLNKVPYMSNETLLLVENELPFSAVSVLHYRYYTDHKALLTALKGSNDIQAIIGHDLLPFGASQQPALSDYADGVDTMAFLCNL
jgi:Acyl-CoA reductase (LuxC)